MAAAKCANPAASQASVVAKRPVALARVADRAGMDDRHRQARQGQSGDHQAFQAASGFQHHPLRTPRAQAVHQVGDAGFLVWTAPMLTTRAQRHIQRRFAHSDAHEDGRCCGAVGRLHWLHRAHPPLIPAIPALQIRASTPRQLFGFCWGAWRDDPGSPTVSSTQERTAYRVTHIEQRP